jgi:phage shock protein PspC (stress-responsive transcriptional regulator)
MWPPGRLSFAIVAFIVLGAVLLVLLYIIWAVTLPEERRVGDERVAAALFSRHPN